MEGDDRICEAVTEDMDAEENGPQVQSVIEESSGASGGAAKPMETEYSGSYEWEIRNFSKLSDKQVSETFEIGTYLWRLLCFPKQNIQPWRFVSVFLEYPEALFTPANLSPKAHFKLIIKNHKDPTKGFTKDAHHTFTADQVDWGFSQMLPLTDLSIGNGYLREDGAVVIRVEITIQRDERYLYDSRSETGYVGLKNQGATCYMNSLLQYLFNVPAFRKAVYHMPVPENEEPSKSLPVALQSLFYKLQYARGAVSTKELTKSFGWNTYDAFMQHDVQELNRVLCEKLEEKMKGTRVEKTINELFEGHTYNFIECINVSYKSTRKESFMDLQLDVKGCRNIYDSFDKYTEVEVLNGANQYKTDDFGMQDARKGILFEGFPPVLQLQLKRFEYDCQRDAMVKINDRYEFYDELDLDRDNGKFLSPTADRSARNLYKLHSVLVHSGGVHGGHYYAYIRSDGKTWLKFDDDRVSREDERQALDMQFGGSDDDYLGSGPYQQPGVTGISGPRYTKFSNAYMLVYVRQSDWPTIMCHVAKEDIAKHLLDRLEREMIDKEARHRDKMEAHLYCSLKVATDADFKQQVGEVSHFDLIDHDKLPPERCHYRLRKQTKFSEFKEEVARRTGIPPERQRFWTWKRRNNGTCRPERPLNPAEEAAQLVDLKDIRELPREGGHGAGGAKSALMDIRLYLEELPADPEASRQIPRDQLLLFFKHYDPVTEELRYHTHYIIPAATTAEALSRYVLEDYEELDEDLPAGVVSLLYEEVKFEPSVMVVLLEGRKQLRDLELENGDVLIFQRQLDSKKAATVRYPTADAYLSYIHNRRQVHFKRLEDPTASTPVTLELLRNTPYDEVCGSLANALGLDDPSKLRLTRHNYFSCQPQRQPVKWRTVQSLEALLTHGQHSTDILYYEVLDLPLEQMEQLKTVRVSFHNERGEFVGEQLSMRLRRESTVAELLAEVAVRLQQAAAATHAAPAAAAATSSPAATPAAAGGQQTGSQGGAPAAGAAGAALSGVQSGAHVAADEAALRAAAAMAAAGQPMRLLEIGSNRIYKVCEPAESIESVNDAYWQLRAEFVPEDQLPSSLGAGDFLVHAAHMLPPPLPASAVAYVAARQQAAVAAAATTVGTEAGAAESATDRGTSGGGGAQPMDAEDGSGRLEDDVTSQQAGGGRDGAAALERALAEQMPGSAFGDPLLLRVRAKETMGQLRARVQAHLGIPTEDFARWHLIFVGKHPLNAPLPDSEVMGDYFKQHSHQFATATAANAAVGGGPTTAVLVDPDRLLLGLLHEDRVGSGGRRQPPLTSRYTYEKPVKIYG